MPLKLRPSGLGSGIDKDRQDYTVYTGGWDIGRIYEVRGGPDHLRWFWSFALHGPMTRSDRATTLEEAKAQFQKSWDEWKAWAPRRSTFCFRVQRLRPNVPSSWSLLCSSALWSIARRSPFARSRWRRWWCCC